MYSPRRLSATAGIVLVIGVLVFGIFQIDSPSTVRKQRFDDIRVNHIWSLVQGIEEFARVNGRIPASTEELKTLPQWDYLLVQSDPETQKQYEYRAGTSTFSWCATFSLDTTERNNKNMYYAVVDPYSRIFNHKSGFVCFENLIPKKVEDVNQPVGKPIGITTF